MDKKCVAEVTEKGEPPHSRTVKGAVVLFSGIIFNHITCLLPMVAVQLATDGDKSCNISSHLLQVLTEWRVWQGSLWRMVSLY